MYFTTHALVGAAVGLSAGAGPAYAFGLGLVSHILCDAVPHNDYYTVKAGIIDFFGGLCFLMLLGASLAERPCFLAGAVGGAIPDLEVVLGFFGLLPFRLFPSHNGLTPHPKANPNLGIAIQLAVSTAALVLISQHLQ